MSCHHNRTQCWICLIKWRLIEDFSVEHPRNKNDQKQQQQHRCKKVVKVRNLCTLLNLHTLISMKIISNHAVRTNFFFFSSFLSFYLISIKLFVWFYVHIGAIAYCAFDGKIGENTVMQQHLSLSFSLNKVKLYTLKKKNNYWLT